MDSQQVRLFNEGYDLASTLGTNGERGTGFGLKICRKYIEKLGGRIWVVANGDLESTVFNVVLPKQDLATSEIV